MEKEENKIPVGLIFMGRGLGDLLELKARCRRRLDFLEKYKGRISSYIYEKLRQEYASYLEAVDGEVTLGLTGYEIKLSEIRLFSNQLKLLEKTYGERIQELALRHALGEYTKEQYDRLYAEHTEKMKRFAETIEKYHGEEHKLAEFLEKVADYGMIGELEAEMEQRAEAASQETIAWSMDKAEEAEETFKEKVAELPEEPLEEPVVSAEPELEEEAPVAEPRAGEPERPLEEQARPQAEEEIEQEAPAYTEIGQQAGMETPPEERPPSAELLIESIERVADDELAEPEETEPALEEIASDLPEKSDVLPEETGTVAQDTGQEEPESGTVEQELFPTAPETAPQPEEPQEESQVEPVSGFEPDEEYSAGTADLPDLQSLEEELEPETESPLEEGIQAGEPVSQEQKSTSITHLDTIFEESAAEDTEAQAEPPAETRIDGEPAEHIAEEEVSQPEEVLPEQTAAQPSEIEEKPEEFAMESTGPAPDEEDLPNGTGIERGAVVEQTESARESAPVDLDAIISAAGAVGETAEPPAPVDTGDMAADSEIDQPEPAEEIAEGQKPETESAGVSQEAPEEQQSSQDAEQLPTETESAEEAGMESEEIVHEPPAESGKPGEEPDKSAEPPEEVPEERDEKDFVIERAISLDDKVELEFDMGGGDNDSEKMLTVDQTIDAIKKKTVKCPQCGAMNYAIRWYCENCEATLTSL